MRAATREISKTAMIWALTHVVQLGRSIILLVVIPAQRSGSKFWGFPLFAGTVQVAISQCWMRNVIYQSCVLN